MERLGEAYQNRRTDGRGRERVLVGVALFAAGVLAVVGALLSVTTPFAHLFGAAGTVPARKLAGLLAGLGVPASLGGVVVVLPASRRERLGVLAGAAICLAAVALFARAYPAHWIGDPGSLAFETAMAYFAGGSVALWFVLTAVADFRRHNSPLGTVRLEVTRRGETRTVELARDEYRRYREAVRGDGGRTEQVIRELESRFDD
ncbi:MAG: hypothetical protein ABEJ89_03855 [Haloarculaceae archaeon]